VVEVALINVHAPQNVFFNKMRLLWEEKNGEKKCTIEEKNTREQESSL
jgi:hypothetical protein